MHALTESVAKRSREEARLTAFAYLMPFLFLPLFWWMGIRDFAPIAVLIGASGATALGLHVYARAHELHRWVLYASVVLTGILLVAGARAFSPFLVVPAIGAVASVPVTYHGDRRLLVVTAIVLSISVTLPAVLEQLGLLSSTFASTADGLELRSAALDIRGTATTIALVGFNIMIVTLPMMLTARLTARTDSYERQIALHSWQLRQLVPRAKDLARARAPEPRSWCA